MMLTLGWKELREHRAIWLTMVLVTSFLGIGLGRIAAADNPANAQAITSLAIIGLSAAYGVVCGAMMLAGEHEGGTITFLDVFLGRRGLLWFGKFGIGIALAIAQGLTVALILNLLKQQPPAWAPGLLGLGGQGAAGLRFGRELGPGPGLWFIVLPLITLESYAWGLLGSALSRRVLPAAALAAGIATPVWMVAVLAPSPVFLGLRLIAFVIVLVVSSTTFLWSLDASWLAPPPPPEPETRRRRTRERWDSNRRDRSPIPRDWRHPPPLPEDAWDEEQDWREDPEEEIPQAIPLVVPLEEDQEEALQGYDKPPPLPRRRRQPREAQAGSAFAALFWLTFHQAWGVFLFLAAACLVLGFFIPTHGQLLWPLATLLLGVGCGAATFSPEQRDLSYQCLAAQHLPLRGVWTFKTVFWLAAAALLTLFLLLGGLLSFLARGLAEGHLPRAERSDLVFRFGNLRTLMGPVLYFSVWLIYGFCIGQICVWLCRKLMLALLLGSLISIAAVALWLPSLLCGGMGGWQLWLPPLLVFGAALILVRAWAGGRIQERRPLMCLAGVALVTLAWAAFHFTVRAWAVPDVGPPLDRAAFRAAIVSDDANGAGRKVLDALAERDDRAAGDAWLKTLAEATRLPPGVIDVPPADSTPLLRHLPAVAGMTHDLRALAQARQNENNHAAALDHLTQMLALSRHVRNKAPIEAYLVGVKIEESALDGLDAWLARTSPDLLRRALDEVKRHAAECPTAVDCLKTECYRSGGMVANPNTWTFAASGGFGALPERWLANGIVFSLELPWEAERKDRLWQLVWSGLFRAVETPHWELPTAVPETVGRKEPTRRILRGWVPAKDSSWTAADVAARLDDSWLADERLFPSVLALRSAGTRSHCRVELAKLSLALALYQAEEGKAAQRLDQLVPKQLPELPKDAYSGGHFMYRISGGERVGEIGDVRAGQGLVFSTGPDRINHGGRAHGGRLPDDSPSWRDGGWDLIAVIPAPRK